MRPCGCTWDPAFHRDLNRRRGRVTAGERCTNGVPDDTYAQQGGVCLPCVFGCPPDEEADR